MLPISEHMPDAKSALDIALAAIGLLKKHAGPVYPTELVGFTVFRGSDGEIYRVVFRADRLPYELWINPHYAQYRNVPRNEAVRVLASAMEWTVERDRQQDQDIDLHWLANAGLWP